MKKMILIITSIQPVLWLLFTLCDYLEETGYLAGLAYALSAITLLAPFLFGILYMVWEGKLCHGTRFMVCRGPLFFINLFFLELVFMALTLLPWMFGGLGLFLLIFAPPLIPPLFYLLLELFWGKKVSWISIPKLKTLLFFSAVWTMEACVLGAGITTLVWSDHWFVHQNMELLNGLEYPLYFWEVLVVPVAVIIILKFLGFLCSMFAGKIEN